MENIKLEEKLKEIDLEIKKLDELECSTRNAGDVFYYHRAFQILLDKREEYIKQYK